MFFSDQQEANLYETDYRLRELQVFDFSYFIVVEYNLKDNFDHLVRVTLFILSFGSKLL